jgi:hypothetical protein
MWIGCEVVDIIQVAIIALPMGNDDHPLHKSQVVSMWIWIKNCWYILPNSMVVSVDTNGKIQIIVVHDWQGFVVPGNYLITVSACFDWCRMQAESH